MNFTSNLSLIGSLLVASGCSGFLRANPDQELAAPAPIQTVQLPPAPPAADGASYYSNLSYTYARGSLRGTVPVAVQLECPSGQTISGSCGVSRRYADGDTDYASYAVFQTVCYDPMTSARRGYGACRTGALLCGAPLQRAYDADGDSPATAEATSATFTFSARCVPTPRP